MKFSGEITHLSQKGYGVVKNTRNAVSYFVHGTWPGDIGEFEAIDKPAHNKKFAYARLLRMITPSPHRQHPACAYMHLKDNPCTGCPWMIADYASQLEQKRKRFLYAMQRVGFDAADLDSVPMQPAPQLFGYRNRCQVKTDGAKLGFINEESGQLVAVSDCIVLNEACRALLKAAIQRLSDESWCFPVNGGIHFVDLDDAMQRGEIQIDRKRPFKQGNTQQNIWMRAWLKEKLAQIPNLNKVVELFCGAGNFTQIIAGSTCHTILAYEAEHTAIDQLQLRQLPKVNACLANLFAPFIWRSLKRHVSDADTLVLDPPRAGLKRQNGFFESFRALKTMIYISCNPETFARDAWFFKQQGWSVDEVQLVDQFPHTPHVEVLAVFRNNA
ncbi:MAG: RNA methyltransferase [Nitrosomonas sp.]|nr:RNA methyltransferase [Nitrosomonas sp.]